MIIGYLKDSKIIKIEKAELVNSRLFINDEFYLKRKQKIQIKCDNCSKIEIKNYYPEKSEEWNIQTLFTKCTREKTNIEKYGVKNSIQHENTKKTLLKKYGVESINQIPEVKEKKKKVFKEKYGLENPWGFGTENYKQSVENKYGTDNPQKVDEIKEKTQATNIEKYGVKSLLEDKEFKKNSMLNKFGVEHNSYLKETIEKRKDKHYNTTFQVLFQNIEPLIQHVIKNKTNEKIETHTLDGLELQKLDIIGYKCAYCGDLIEQQYRFKDKFHNGILLCPHCNKSLNNPFKQQDVKEKIKETKEKKYGNSLYTNRKKAKETMIEKYGEYYTNRKQAKETNLQKYGVEHHNQNEKIKEKIVSTKEERYGDPYFNNRKKFQSTMLEKYGGTNVLNSELKQQIFDSKSINAIQRINKVVIPQFSLHEWRNKQNKYQNFLWKCRICNNEFESCFANGRIPRCPNCFPPIKGFSSAEKEIVNWLKSLGIEVEENNRSILHGKELDILLPQYNIAIEFNGLYWHSELQGKDKHYHLNKTLECKNSNIELIHIFEDEWIEKQPIVKSIVSGKLGLHQKIGARKCIIKEISTPHEFYNMNHIQGSVGSSKSVGLFYQDELVSAISFGKSRFNKKYDWEITRYANKLNLSVIGGFSKMLKYFRNHYQGSIITYSDRRYFNGGIYKNNGFTELESSTSNYWYTDYKTKWSRVSFQKHKLEEKLQHYDPELTEWENMQMNGWDRIWDCGNSVWILT